MMLMMMKNMTMAETWTAMGSTIASLIVFWEIIRLYCPDGLRRHLEKYTTRLTRFFNPYIEISVHEFTGSNLKAQKAYAVIEAYLGQNNSRSAKRLKAELVKGSNMLALSMDDKETVTDDFRGVKVRWSAGKKVIPASPSSPSMFYHPEPERRFYKLSFHKRYRYLVTESYLEHVVKTGKELKAKKRQRKLYTNSKYGYWNYIDFKHPATFDSLAMEPDNKQEIIEDLLTFRESKDFYARIGKAWKRGYLLHGPPGTGKSTMIAAMANLLDYNVYDLELTSVMDNTDLRRLLIETTSKSIIVIEDIDCCLDLTGQRKKVAKKASDDNENGKKENHSKEHKEDGGTKVTLSGLLNFIDGLWSACEGERIIVFTTNYVEKLDPALTRRGRMDKSIYFPYCGFEGFKVLAKNYLQLETHPLFEPIQKLMGETKITPADVAENLMPKSPKEDAERRLSNLIQALQEAKEEAKTKKSEEAKDPEAAQQQDSQQLQDEMKAEKP